MSNPRPEKLDYQKALHWSPVPDEQLYRAAIIITKDTNTQLRTIKRMEENFADLAGSRYALSVNNGTAAIFSSAYALRLEPGSEILVPSYTFWSSVLPLLWAGLIPVFCDIDPETLCISIDDIEKKHSVRTKAVLVAHLFGQLAGMEKILEFAGQHDLRIIEDASQAFGAKFQGRMAGTLGDAGCFSLQTSKYLSAGEGGMLVTNNRDIYENAVCLGHYRRIPALNNPDLTAFENTGFGFKFRIHPFAAAVAEEFLTHIEAKLAHIDHTMNMLATALKEFSCFAIPKVENKCKRTFWTRFHVLYRPEFLNGIPKSELIRTFNDAGILIFDKISKYGSGLHKEPFFTGTGFFPGSGVPEAGPLPVTENIEKNNLLAFPVFVNADEIFIKRYTGLIKQIITKIEEGDTGA